MKSDKTYDDTLEISAMQEFSTIDRLTIEKALLDLVEFVDPTGNTLVARVPPDGTGELRPGD